jgi:Ala-tRNA(Pro) deacylase
MSAEQDRETPPADSLFNFLKEQDIDYQREDHQPVFMVAESKTLNLKLQGGATKNLFLRDKKGKRHFLFSVEQGKQVDLKGLSALLDSSRLSLGSSERLWKYLGVLPGAVSLLALISDSSGEVEVLIDEDLWEKEAVLCHPLVNSSTLTLRRADLERFMHQTGHSFQLVSVSQKTATIKS